MNCVLTLGNMKCSQRFQVAEAEGSQTTAVDLISRLEGYEFMLDHLQKLAEAGGESFEQWK